MDHEQTPCSLQNMVFKKSWSEKGFWIIQKM